MIRFLAPAFLTAFLLSPLPARAQHGDEHEEMMDMPEPEAKPDHGARMIKMLEKRLKLTPEQRKKLAAAIKEGQPEQEKLQKEVKALREQMQKLMQRQHERVRAVLDDEQKWKFDELTVEMRKRGQAGQGRGRPQGPRRRPGPIEDEGDQKDLGPRDMPPPEMWQDDSKGGDKPESRKDGR